ncbi:MAG: HD domain-containing protein [Candidatus Berkelbacteria bacterium]|nr:HD domain-containing protein [Candidatus Berkelbacteria bacterium]
MTKEELIDAAENYFRTHLPSTREKNSYLVHVEGVQKYALHLADEYDADKTVVEVAALLHDVGADAGDVHSAKSAEIAAEFLKDLDIESDLEKRIISAIKNHSMRQTGESFSASVTLEDRVIRDADGISFIENSYEMYFQKGLERHGLEIAREKSISKITGMMRKITTKKGTEIAEKLKNKAIEVIRNK